MAAKHLKLVKKRIGWLLLIFAVLYVGIAGRLFYIQVLRNEQYKRLADRLRLRQLVIAAERGAVYDRVGRQLAVSVPACAVYAHPQKIRDKERVASLLSSMMGIDGSVIEGALSTRSRFAYLGRQLSPEVGERVEHADLRAIGVLRESKRIYPLGTLACHVLGFTDVDGRGVEGLERTADQSLAGRDGYTIAEVDPNGRIIPETRRGSIPSVDGRDVVLTIDAYLQHAAEEALRESAESCDAAGGTAIVLDPYTGEILALANCPMFDPGNRRGASPAAWRDRGVTDLYEPGSTMKLVTVAAGLEEGLSPTAAVATCTSAGMRIGKRRVHCPPHPPYGGGHGAVDMPRVIAESCNVGAATIALRIGPGRLYSYIKAFGLLEKPGSGLSGEVSSRLEPPQTWPTIKLANIGFGQGVSVTALQMASAYAVIANGGNLIRLQIIRELRDENGRVATQFSPQVVRRVVSEQTARLVTEMLVGCVNEGTGKPSKIEGYTVAGKTGSAQKASTMGRGYVPGKFVASFMGFLPARNPRIVICVVIDEPRVDHSGAAVAAPVFKEIAQKAMWYLRVPPDQERGPGIAPAGGSIRAKELHDKLGAGHTG